MTGDELLTRTAERFRAALRDVDTIARLGGDEFAVILDGELSPDVLSRTGQRILDALSEPMTIGDRSVSVTASIGMALTRHSDADADSLLRNADAAMYRAKRDGKACCRLFEDWMHSEAVELLEVEQSLRAAVTGGRSRCTTSPWWTPRRVA